MQGSQLIAVVLQAWVKMPLLGALVSVSYGSGILYWCFLGAIFINAVYPSVLLVNTAAWSRRGERVNGLP